jgi:hypothetical protein
MCQREVDNTMHRISIDTAKIILEALAAHGSKGCGIISLSLETGISKSKLRSFLKSNKEFATAVYGQSKFKLNKFGAQRGSVEEMLDVIRQRRRYAVVMNWIAVFVFIFIFYRTY